MKKETLIGISIAFVMPAILTVLFTMIPFNELKQTKDQLVHMTEIAQSYEKEIEQLRREIAQRDAKIAQLTEKVNTREITDYWTKQLLVRLVDSIKEAYYIRNEILYYNPNLDRVDASYQALWYYTVALEEDLHPYLITAVAVSESNLRHFTNGKLTQSHAGAKGAMQLTSIIERLYNVDASVFEENIKGGASFLKDLESMYDNNLELMLAHYNAGSRVYKALKEFPETINFVKNTIHIYKTMLEKY